MTPWSASCQASRSFTISKSLLKLMSIKSVMLSNHLNLCLGLLLLPSIFPSIRVFSNEPALCIRWPQYWSFSFSISLFNEYSGLISFKIDWVWFPCCPRDFQESSPASQFESISSLALSFLYGPIVISIHDYCKKHSFNYTDLCQWCFCSLICCLLSPSKFPKFQFLCLWSLSYVMKYDTTTSSYPDQAFWYVISNCCYYLKTFFHWFSQSDGTYGTKI